MAGREQRGPPPHAEFFGRPKEEYPSMEDQYIRRRMENQRYDEFSRYGPRKMDPRDPRARMDARIEARMEERVPHREHREFPEQAGPDGRGYDPRQSRQYMDPRDPRHHPERPRVDPRDPRYGEKYAPDPRMEQREAHRYREREYMDSVMAHRQEAEQQRRLYERNRYMSERMKSRHQEKAGMHHRRVADGNKILVIIRGFPGSGKTQLARSICQKFGGNHVICSEDRYHWSSGEVGVGTFMFKPEINWQTRDWCAREVVEALREGMPLVVVDNINYRIIHYEEHIRIAFQLGYAVKILEIKHDQDLLPKFRSRCKLNLAEEEWMRLGEKWETDPRVQLLYPSFCKEKPKESLHPMKGRHVKEQEQRAAFAGSSFENLVRIFQEGKETGAEIADKNQEGTYPDVPNPHMKPEFVRGDKELEEEMGSKEPPDWRHNVEFTQGRVIRGADSRDPREMRDPRDPRNQDPRADPREQRESQDLRDHDPRDPRNQKVDPNIDWRHNVEFTQGRVMKTSPRRQPYKGQGFPPQERPGFAPRDGHGFIPRDGQGFPPREGQGFGVRHDYSLD